jgi:hypothetical protein
MDHRPYVLNFPHVMLKLLLDEIFNYSSSSIYLRLLVGSFRIDSHQLQEVISLSNGLPKPDILITTIYYLPTYIDSTY